MREIGSAAEPQPYTTPSSIDAALVDGIQACLRASAPLAALVAAILAVCTGAPTLTPSFFGFGVSMSGAAILDLLLAWSGVALLYFVLGLTHVRRANASTYCELTSQLSELRGTHDAVCEAGAVADSALAPSNAVQIERAKKQFHLFADEVGSALAGKAWGRTVWVLGMGYVSAWQMLHRAQEALINIEPLGAVLERAEYDALSLTGSSVAGHAQLKESLRAAVDLISPFVTSGADMAAMDDLQRVLLKTDARLTQLRAASGSEPDVDGAAQDLALAISVMVGAPIPVPEKLAAYTALQALQTRLSLHASTEDEASTLVAYADTPDGHAVGVKGSRAGTASNGTAGSVARGAVPLSLVSVETAQERLRVFLGRLGSPEHRDAMHTHVASGAGRASTSAASTNSTSPLRVPRSLSEARTTVGMVRQTLNDYRDSSRAGLVRARNQLACTTTVTGLISYAVLWLALVAGLPPERLQAAAAFFLIGALVGLFSRLYSDFGSDTATDDFGLSAMRHLTAPQLSGVAGVLGVALVALTTNMNAASATSVLGMAFQMPAQPLYFVSAALFGLTPGLLIDRLKQQTEQLKNNLRTTQPEPGSSESAVTARA